ncbi:YcxB family protein [Streptacidiphilus sp. ASG 303]|uniref:YcxB family protein n=1 Tax=Streptacidiphilus sp. ASG 303 TaxID=2896847 RepID=UPI001E5D6B8D|nr:YcxB family protein [Streptacidiphilus sp. ASG 303]MCD0486214.1 YcxB family protein [Streptacidiphilus sp. ASG 303]
MTQQTGRTVALTYSTDAADWADAFSTAFRTRRSWILKPWFTLPLSLAGGWTAVRAGDWWVLILVGFLVVMSVLPRLVFLPAGRRIARNNPQVCRDLAVTLDDGGVHTVTAVAEARASWAQYAHYAETERVFVLMTAKRGAMVQPLPKRALPDAETERHLRELLDGHLVRIGPGRR